MEYEFTPATSRPRYRLTEYLGRLLAAQRHVLSTPPRSVRQDGLCVPPRPQTRQKCQMSRDRSAVRTRPESAFPGWQARARFAETRVTPPLDDCAMASRSRYANPGEMTNERAPAVVYHDTVRDCLTRAGILLGFWRERSGRLWLERCNKLR